MSLLDLLKRTRREMAADQGGAARKPDVMGVAILLAIQGLVWFILGCVFTRWLLGS
jgi:hypothetical protein